MKVAITGALGHLGSALLGSIGEEHEVIAIDNMSSNHHAVLFGLKRHIDFVPEDILTADLESLFKGCDVVVHLAAITDAAHSHLHKDEVESVNVMGTERVANACVQVEAKMIFPSSTSVYGMNNAIVDELGETNPQSPYAESKLAAEKILLGKNGLSVAVMRFGTVYGLSFGGRFHTAVHAFSWNAAMNRPIEVWSTAWFQKRPYLWVGDATSAILHTIDKELFENEIYNVVSSNHTVAEIIAEISRYRPNIRVKFVESPIMNQLSYTVSSDKFIRTGWNPSGNLQDGMRQEMEMLSWIN